MAPIKRNTIPYNVYDDNGNVVVEVLQDRDNRSERARILQAMPAATDIPNTDKHIVCPKCTKDFGIALSSQTIVRNTKKGLRRAKCGYEMHNAYLKHLGSCDGTHHAISNEELKTAARVPRTTKSGEPRQARGAKAKGAKSSNAKARQLPIDDYRIPIITRDTFVTLNKVKGSEAATANGPVHAVLTRFLREIVIDDDFWLKRVVKPTVETIYFQSEYNRVAVYVRSERNFIYRTLSGIDGPGWVTISADDESALFDQKVSQQIITTIARTLVTASYIHCDEITASNAKYNATITPKIDQFVSFVYKNVKRVMANASLPVFYDLFADAENDVFRSLKAHGAPLNFVDASDDELTTAHEPDDILEVSDGEGAGEKSEANAPATTTDAPATTTDAAVVVMATDSDTIDTLVDIYTALDHIPTSLVDAPDVPDEARSYFHDLMHTVALNFGEAVDKAKPELPSLEDLEDFVDDKIIARYHDKLQKMYVWLYKLHKAKQVEEASKQPEEEKKGRKRGRSAEPRETRSSRAKPSKMTNIDEQHEP